MCELPGVPMPKESDPDGRPDQDAWYERLALEYGGALQRVAAAYEANAEQRRDLLQEIHVASGAASPFSSTSALCVPGSTALPTIQP